MELVDTHAHLEEIENLKDAIENAVKVGVKAIIAMGSDYDSNVWVLNESRKYEVEGLKIYPAIGLHPWGLDPMKASETISFIEKFVDEVVAIGEIGLDYWYKEVRKNEDLKRLQREVFRRVLTIARDRGKPVSIHSRGAWMDCVDITIEIGVKKAVFHWFSGPMEALRKILDHGYYISATPAAAYSKEHRKAIAETPLENIVLETDSPVIYAGEKSEPAHIIKALNAVAELKRMSVEVVAEKTTENAVKIFGLKWF